MDKFLKAYKYTWPFAALLIAHLIWGGNYIAAKLTLNEIPPLSLGFIRFFLASLFLLPFLLTDKKNWKIEKSDLPKLCLIGVLMVTLHIGFFFEGLKRTSVTDAAVLLLAVPILSTLAGWGFLKEKVNFLNITGIFLGFCGVLTFTGLGNLLSGTQIEASTLVGNILILLSALTWVIGAAISKKLLAQYSTLMVTWIMFVVGAFTFFFPALNEYIQDPGWVSHVTILGLLGVIYITLGSSISAYFLFEWGLKKLGVIKADLFQYIEPMIASILGVIILGESLGPIFFIGSALVSLGAVLGSFSTKLHHIHHKAKRG